MAIYKVIFKYTFVFRYVEPVYQAEDRLPGLFV